MSFTNRHSVYSTTSASPYAGGAGANQAVGNLTTSSLLSALHNTYLSGTPYLLDAATTIVVNPGAGQGSSGFSGVIDEGVGPRAWEHARRRAEDQTIVLA
jgi:chitin synthase